MMRVLVASSGLIVGVLAISGCGQDGRDAARLADIETQHESSVQHQRIQSTRARMHEIESAIQAYQGSHQRYPDSLRELVSRRELEERQLKDAWGNDIVYRSPNSDGCGFEVISWGQDGKAGGEGAAADVEMRGYPPARPGEVSPWVNEVMAAVHTYYARNKRYPDSLRDLVASGHLRESQLKDPFGNDIVYRRSHERGRDFHVASYDKDGKPAVPGCRREQ